MTVILRINLDLCPKAHDHNIDAAWRHATIAAPNSIQQPFAAEDAARMGHEKMQKVELQNGQLDDVPLHHHLVSGNV